MTNITYDERQAMVDYSNKGAVTLNDKQAYISGVRNDFATIWTDCGLTYEWSWKTVKRIINEKGGAFHS